MRRITASILALLMLCVSNVSYAYTDNILEGMWNKLIRGCVNTATGFLEIPGQTIKGYQASGDELHDKILGTATGLIKGVFDAVGRTAWGVVEAAGFWTANPKDNLDIGIPLDSEYVWEKNTVETGLYNVNVEGGAGRVSAKLLRGVGNTVFGVLEFPGQIVKGYKNKTSDLGILRSIWFTASREVYGVADLATLLLPSPKKNVGYAFEEEKPWDALIETFQ
ncbi:MAG: hypothetical protein JW800_07900 [Candidatus Omnitrophica bacterium]|nr:hypothetical protein [Candidatus Omnitrophota bacterium]